MAADNSDLALWIVDEDGNDIKRTFAELLRRSNQVGNFLRALGARRGDHLLVMLGNQAPFWEVLLAAMKLGAVVIPAAPLLTTEDLRDRLERGRVRYVIAEAVHAAKFDELIGSYSRISTGGKVAGWHSLEDASEHAALSTPDGPTAARDPLLLYFTSGTTAKPKLVLHTHVSYPVGHLSTMYWIGVQPGDLHCNVSAPGWGKHAWSGFFAPWNAEATVFVPNQTRFSPKGLLKAISLANVTTFCAPPTIWRMLVARELTDYKTQLREVVSAGEPLDPKVIDRVRTAWGLTVREGYGQTETTAVAGTSPAQLVKPASLGRPLPGFKLVLLDSNDEESNEGELCVALNPRPLGLMPGYQKDDGTISEVDGTVHRTGDVMSRDVDGYLLFVGRKDDVFKASDYRISPFELERALIEHPEVIECAVVPMPDSIRLAVPKAFVMLRAGYEPGADLAPASCSDLSGSAWLHISAFDVWSFQTCQKRSLARSAARSSGRSSRTAPFRSGGR